MSDEQEKLGTVPESGTVPNFSPWKPKFNPWIIAITVTLATFMEVLDTTVTNVSLPHIAGNLSATTDEAAWILTSYLVSNAIVLPVSGWVMMLIGRKKFYMMCVALFTAASALCGFAPSLAMLVTSRIIQGLGGGGLQPSEQAILVDTFPPEKRGMGMAVYGVAVVCAPIIGPTLGGWITDNFSWRWIFFINIPVGILSLLLTYHIVEDPPYIKRPDKGFKIDYFGIILLTFGMGFLQIMLDRGERDDWFSSTFIMICAAISGLSILSAILWETKVKNPVIELSLYKDRNFTIANLTMLLLGFALFGSTVLLPLYLQTLMGYSATLSGMVLSPGGFVTIVMMPIVGLLLGKWDAKWLVIIGVVTACFSLYKMAHFDLNINYMTAVTARMIQAFGLAFLFIPINVAAFAFVPKDKSNAATSLINLARNIGGSTGISIATTILARRAQFHQSILSSRITPYNPEVQTFLNRATAMGVYHGSTQIQASHQAWGMLGGFLARQSQMLTFLDAFWFLGASFFLLVPLLLFMKKPPAKKPGEMSFH